MTASCAERVRELLAPGSEFSRRFAARFGHDRGASDAAVDYEDRPGQRAFAAQAAETLEHGGILVAEAPTGIGKSLAYLLPAVLLAHAEERRVVIATCSRSLQDQLFERDLPAVLEALDLKLPCVRLKGKQNYVCVRALDRADGEGAEETETLEALRHWASHDAEGDLDRFQPADAEAFRRVRPRLGADPDACTAVTCRRGRECFWVRARRQAQQAKILVINHALLAISGGVEGLLPEFDALIVDEAHRLEGVLLQQLGRASSLGRIEELLRITGSAGGAGKRGSGLAGRLRGFALPLLASVEPARAERWAADLAALGERASAARLAAEGLFANFESSANSVNAEARGRRGTSAYGFRSRYRTTEDLLGRELASLEEVLVHGAWFARTLGRLAHEVIATDPGSASSELSAELDQVAARWTACMSDLETLADPAQRDWVYWRTGGTRRVELHGAPVFAGPHARRLVLERCPAVVLTSATLSAGGDLGFVAGRLGLGPEHGVAYTPAIHPTPFQLERQMRAYIYDGGADEAAAVAAVVEALHVRTRRNLLVLFTSHERLRRARQRLIERLPGDSVMIAQEWDGSASQVSDRFRVERGAILLGVQSLWEGVDFPGGALEVLVVAKLPFSVPDEPWVEARGERLVEQGRDPFRDDAVPEAVLRFRQGVGRLIRRADDRGVLVACDARLATSSYRKPFLAAMGVAPRVRIDADALAAEAARFLEQEVPVEEHR